MTTRRATARAWRAAFLLSAIELGAGCTTDPAPAPHADAGPDVLVGAFALSLIAPTSADPEGHTTLLGRVNDGPSPELVIWSETAREDDCALLEPSVPFCTEPCAGDEACVGEDVCEPYPRARSVGTVRIDGVKTTSGATAFAMKPVSNTYQPPAGVELAFPPFAEGDRIRAQAEGGHYAPFTLEAAGIAPLELADRELGLERDRALELAWRAAEAPDSARILVKLDISHHGGSKGKIECETADDGELALAPALVNGLLDLGYAGYPTVIVTRRSRGAARIELGEVELTITSRVERAVSVPGLTSCTKDEHCEQGQTCAADLSCR